MIKDIDDLLHHWAQQNRSGGMRQCSPLGKLVEFGGVPPRDTRPKGSRDPLALGDMDEAAWQVEQALQALDDQDQVLAHEHYRFGGYNDDKARRLGLAERTYYDRLDRLQANLQAQLQQNLSRRHA